MISVCLLLKQKQDKNRKQKEQKIVCNWQVNLKLFDEYCLQFHWMNIHWCSQSFPNLKVPYPEDKSEEIEIKRTQMI